MASQLLGRWDVTVRGGKTTFPSWFEIVSHEDGLSGQFVGQVGSARPIPHVRVNGDEFEFSLPKQYEDRTDDLTFKGRCNDDGTLEGTTDDGKGNELSWTATRAPGFSEDASPGWGDPVELINGRDLSNWRPRTEWKSAWSIKDGALDNAEVGSDLVTLDTFSDFKLVAEYRYPKGSNSGIYLRGRYEFQILDDFGSDPHVGGSGAIYGFIAPKRNAVKPADEWQTAEITLLGRHITVVLNGDKVIDHREIPGITGGALDSDEGAPGPIFVQGDHGPVTFRKLTLYPAV